MSQEKAGCWNSDRKPVLKLCEGTADEVTIEGCLTDGRRPRVTIHATGGCMAAGGPPADYDGCVDGDRKPHWSNLPDCPGACGPCQDGTGPYQASLTWCGMTLPIANALVGGVYVPEVAIGGTTYRGTWAWDSQAQICRATISLPGCPSECGVLRDACRPFYVTAIVSGYVAPFEWLNGQYLLEFSGETADQYGATWTYTNTEASKHLHPCYANAGAPEGHGIKSYCSFSIYCSTQNGPLTLSVAGTLQISANSGVYSLYTCENNGFLPVCPDPPGAYCETPTVCYLYRKYCYHAVQCAPVLDDSDPPAAPHFKTFTGNEAINLLCSRGDNNLLEAHHATVCRMSNERYVKYPGQDPTSQVWYTDIDPQLKFYFTIEPDPPAGPMAAGPAPMNLSAASEADVAAEPAAPLLAPAPVSLPRRLAAAAVAITENALGANQRPAEEVARIGAICQACPERKTLLTAWCGRCGCLLGQKIANASTSCPLGKWTSEPPA